MTLEEAIEHAEQTAASCGGECADDHWQLAEWLRELRRARMELDLLRTLREEFRADAQRYKAENDKLRELVHKQDALTKAVYEYWSGGERSLDDFSAMMYVNAQVLTLMQELGIEAK